MSAKSAIASVRANPRSAYPNNVLVSEGLRATETIRLPNTFPIPTPAPASAIVAHPAPINLAPSDINNSKFERKECIRYTEIRMAESVHLRVYHTIFP